MIRVVPLLALAYVLNVGVLQAWTSGGIAPSLLTHVVVAVACVRGPSAGGVVGFVVGLLVDVSPTSIHPLGTGAIAFTLAGWAVGAAASARWAQTERTWSRALVALALTAGSLMVLAGSFAAMNAVVGDGGGTGVVLAGAWPGVLTALLAPFVVPLLIRFLRR